MTDHLHQLAKRAKEAARQLALYDTEQKNRALLAIAQALEDNIPAILALLVTSASLGSIMGTIYFKWRWAATVLLVVVFGMFGGVGGFSVAGGGEDVAQLVEKAARFLAEFPWWLALAAAAALAADAAFQWLLLRKQEVRL